MPDPQQWISQREAAFFVQCGARVTERVARRVLAAGLAGEPRRVTTALLYERRRVVELAGRPVVPDAELDSACSQGLFVSRRRGDPRRGWRYSPWTCVWLRVRIERHGFFPLVTTLGGYVLSGHDMVDAAPSGALELVEPGSWFAALEGRRVATGPGRDWWIRGLDKPHGRLQA